MPAASPHTKVVQTYRLARQLVGFLKEEAAERGLDVSALASRILDGYRSYYGMPPAAVASLERDRRELGLDRLAYLQQLVFGRAELVSLRGPGAPFTPEDSPRRHD